MPCRVVALDGLRGIAILTVVAFHASFALGTAGVQGALLSVYRYGYLGVDLFFALSGFLITKTLVRDMERPGYPWRFYIRRTLRIVPAYYLYLLMLAAAYPVWRTSGFAWYATFLANFKPDLGLNDAKAIHLWSIAVEVQFYLIWPLVVYLAGKRRLPGACMAFAAASLAARLLIMPSEAMHRMTFYRLDVLCLGALMAVVAIRPKLAGWTGTAFVLIGLRCSGTHLEFTVGYAALAIGFSLVVKWGSETGTGLAFRLVSAGWLRQVGRVSYAMYLVHLMVLAVTWLLLKHVPIAGGYLLAPAVALVSFLIASASWKYVEGPLNRMAPRRLTSIDYRFTEMAHRRRSLWPAIQS